MQPFLLTPRCSPRGITDRGTSQGNLCLTAGKSGRMHFPRDGRSEGGEAGAGSQGKQSRLVCTGCISSGESCFICRYVFKGDTRVQGSTRDAPGINCLPSGNLSGEAGVCGSQPFPRGEFLLATDFPNKTWSYGTFQKLIQPGKARDQ